MIIFTLQFWLALTASLLLVALVSFEIYHVLAKGQKRYFWNGLFTLAMILLTGYVSALLWTLTIKKSVELSYGDNLISHGSMNLNMAIGSFKNKPAMCTVNGSDESKTCMKKLKLIHYEEPGMIDFYVSDNDVSFVFGTWPFHTILQLPLSEFDNDWVGMFGN